MTPFKQISIEDREVIYPHIFHGAEPICDISFANLFGWSLQYETSWAIGGTQTLVIRFRSPRRDHPVYLCPFCRNDESWMSAVRELMQISESEGYPLVFMGVTDSCRERLDRTFPDQFFDIQDDDYIDYVYLRDKLARLNGKKLQPKRNHINRFEATHPDYRYCPITPAALPRIAAFADQWLAASSDADESLVMENRVIHRFIDHYSALDMLGGYIEISDEIVAFTMGSPITAEFFDVHIEKARPDIDGAYTIINREFARHVPEQYTYLNREEDLGLPGLRKAKESYGPDIRLVKHTSIWRRPGLPKA